MIELSIKERGILRPLCNESIDEVVLFSCIEGNIGRVWADKRDNPSCAIAVAADFCYLLGCIDESGPSEEILKLLENCRRKIILTNEISWISFIEKHYKNCYKKFSRFAIKKEPKIFLYEKLYKFIRAVSNDYIVRRIDEFIYYKALEDDFTADFCSNFSSYDEFQEHGIGYVVLHKGEIIAGASSYTYCQGKIEITVGTVKEYRRKGLALACASKLILECLERNIYPNWDSANLESVALAERLGYHFDKEYDVYYI